MPYRNLPLHKGVYILPNLFTSGSLFTGFLGLLYASNGRIEACALCILASALLDGLDGKVARLTNTSSEFGIQYDSLADLVAFGVTPGFMIHAWQIHAFGRMGSTVAFLLVVCGALRLARFNVTAGTGGKKFFTGLPIPASGCTLACLVLFYRYIPSWAMPAFPAFCLGLTLLLAFLMVSRVRYVSFKEYGFVKAHPFRWMVTAITLFALIASYPKLLGFTIFAVYILSGLIYTFFIMPRRLHPADKPSGGTPPPPGKAE